MLTMRQQKRVVDYLARFPRPVFVVVRKWPRLWGWCRGLGMTEDEVNSECLLAVCHAAAAWFPGHRMHEFAALAVMTMKQVLRHECRHREARKRRWKPLPLVGNEPAPEPAERPDPALLDQLAGRLRTLPDRMFDLVAWRFGLGGETLSRKEVERRLGLSRHKTLALERRALARLGWHG